MEVFITLVCAISAVLGAVAIFTGYSSLHSTVRIVADVWLVGLLILTKAYKREYWSARSKPFKEFIANAPKPSRLEQVLNFGLLALIAIQIGLFFL